MNRILVIQSGKLGDMVCTTPVFRAIKEAYPGTFLIVSGDKINKEVLAGNPHISEYVVLKELDRGLVESMDIDVAVLLNPNPKVLWLLLRARVPRVVVPKITGGYSPYATKMYRLLSLFATRVSHNMRRYAPREYLRMLEPLGVYSTDTTKEVFVSEEALGRARQLFSEFQGRIKVAIAPGAGNKIKEWPPEKFNEVSKHFSAKGAAVILIGGPSDTHLGEIVRDGVSYVLDTIGKLSIEELKAVINQVDIFISADTGPIYIAEACGVPTVDIVGPVDAAVQPPQGRKHLVVLPPGYIPQLYIMNARVYDRGVAEKLAQSTPVESVIKAAENLLYG